MNYLMMGVRKKHLGEVRRLARLESWSFPLFEKMSPMFLQDAETLLVTCTYEPGDYIVRQVTFTYPRSLLIYSSSLLSSSMIVSHTLLVTCIYEPGDHIVRQVQM